MRIVFCGTPDFAVPTLEGLLGETDFAVEAVLTQPDRPRGRGQQVASSPVKDRALDAGVHIYQPEKIKSDSAYEFFKRLQPDAVVIIAYGQIIPPRLIELPRLGWVNLHASLLPAYRGAAPVNWAIINGEMCTGLTTMQIDAGLDTGPILLQRTLGIGADETAPALAQRLAVAGAPLMIETLRKLDRGGIAPVIQDHTKATLAPRLKKEDGRINWRHAAAQIYNRIRGLEPWPGAFTTFRGRLCHVWGRPAAAVARAEAPGTLFASSSGLQVACGEGTRLRLDAVQLEGRKRIAAADFGHGARLVSGEKLGP